jgi:hypothetical protein
MRRSARESCDKAWRVLTDAQTTAHGENGCDPVGVALRVARAVEACQGAYLVEGLGPEESIVIVLDLPLGGVQRFVSELGPAFEVGSEKQLRDALLAGHDRRILFVPTALDVDLLAVGRAEFDAVEFARRRRVTVRPGGETLVVKSAEDGLLRTLLEFSNQGLVSERDWREVVGLLGAGAASLDFGHLVSWAARLGVAEMLDQARSESAATHVALRG